MSQQQATTTFQLLDRDARVENKSKIGHFSKIFKAQSQQHSKFQYTAVYGYRTYTTKVTVCGSNTQKVNLSKLPEIPYIHK